MDRAFTHIQERDDSQIRHFQRVERPRRPDYSNPFPKLGSRFRNLYQKARFANGFRFGMKKIEKSLMVVVNNSVFGCSETEERETMESYAEREEAFEGVRGICIEDIRGNESSSSSDFLISEATDHEEHSPSSTQESSSTICVDWHVQKFNAKVSISPHGSSKDEDKTVLEDKQGSRVSEIEMMKERFSKLLLGEDMSGCGNGVCTALAISNAITNLCATLFGQLWRLEPLPPEKKAMWKREMDWLLCVSDHIVELMPSWQDFPDGSKLEVMTCRPRSDLYVNLPALRKLDNMLLEILNSFKNTEFWYVDQGILASEGDGSASFRRALQRQEEKWWLPVPCVPPSGLHEESRRELQHKRDCTNQILKAAMAINSITLAEMEIPNSYLESLPKNGRVCLGDIIYRYISSDHFSPECLLDCIDLSSEHQATDIANRVEASIYVWRKRTNSKPRNTIARSGSRSSWDMVKELMVDADKRELLADRAESLLLSLKQRFPGLPQTSLDTSKIQCNKDVGKSILESYSRVLESLAFNIIARIDDLLYVDDMTKHLDESPNVTFPYNAARISSAPYKTTCISSSPYKTSFTTPTFSPAKGEKSSLKNVVTNSRNVDPKPRFEIKADGSSSSSSPDRIGVIRLDDILKGKVECLTAGKVLQECVVFERD